MEPVTHLLTGACLARSGFHRRIAYATAAMTIAAEFPDIDTVWGLRGPITGFQHHRGITHTFVGIPFEAGLLLVGFLAWHRWRTRHTLRTGAPDRAAAAETPPPLWLPLYGCLLIALLSHLLLDYTNNYGLRPFFPFDRHWYAASLVFIFDPLLFLFLLLGLGLPWFLGLISREVGERGRPYVSAVPARLALLAVVCLWTARAFEHSRALQLASLDTLRSPEDAATVPSAVTPLSTGDETAKTVPSAVGAPLPAVPRPLLQPRHVLASPDPLSIFRWYTAADFGPSLRRSTAETLRGTLTPGPTLPKAGPTPVLVAAQHSDLGRVYADWSAMPWLSVVQGSTSSCSPTAATSVLFEDARFLGDNSFLHRGAQPPLTGFVVVGSQGQVLEQGIDGKPQP